MSQGEQSRAYLRSLGAKVSDGPIENFREGWAILPFVGEKPHYWRRIDLTNCYISECGIKGGLATAQQLHARGMPHAQSVKLLAEGDFKGDRCQRCANKAQRRGLR